ncbi:MAG TPA: hypothetical protein VHT93_08215 [Pseudolabrys sp.]|jgi:hypothetical protein|nr:hypothetical protein [Pseudolabrys sp.]
MPKRSEDNVMGQVQEGSDRAPRKTPHSDTARGEQTIGGAAETVKDTVRDVAEEQKNAGAERIEAVGRAVHGAADQLGKEIPQAAPYIHSAAETLEGAASWLQGRSVDEFVTSLNRFARQQPAAAFAGSVLAGFALARFLKSSEH